jgi:hypothetical protein
MTLKEYPKAQEDAEQAVKLDPTFAKGYYRIAMALSE